MRPLLFCIVLTAVSSLARGGDTLRCGSRIISTGALAAEVLGVCGEPQYRDVWVFPHFSYPGLVHDTEEWYYNFGPNQLLRILRLRNGRLVSIESDGYGYSQSSPLECTLDGRLQGQSKLRLLRLCGEPVTRESLNVLTPLPRRPGVGPPGFAGLQPVFRERWVYNLGADVLLREVTLENGRVVSVDYGGHGFDAHRPAPY